MLEVQPPEHELELELPDDDPELEELEPQVSVNVHPLPVTLLSESHDIVCPLCTPVQVGPELPLA